MNIVRLLWYFLWRMVAWMVVLIATIGILCVLVIDERFSSDVSGVISAGEVVTVLSIGAFFGGVFGLGLGLVCGLALAVLTLALRPIPEKAVRYRVSAAALCTAITAVPAGLLALLQPDYYPAEGFNITIAWLAIGIPLLISAPFCAFAAYRVARVYSMRNQWAETPASR